MDTLSQLLAGFFSGLERTEQDDPFAQFLRSGNRLTFRKLKIVLDDRGAYARYRRFEQLHCTTITLEYRETHYFLSGRGLFEQDSWTTSEFVDHEQKQNRRFSLAVAFTWSQSILADESKGIALCPGHLAAVLKTLNRLWLQSRQA